MPTLGGLDLAWKDHNPSALAIGTLHERTLTLTHLYSAIIGLPNLSTYLAAHPDLTGIAIDAPLIIPNAHRPTHLRG
jgi:predicted RNase H-like nuclease